MDPFTLFVILALYFFAAPDRRTASIRGGLAGSIGSSSRAAAGSIRSGWRSGRSSRSAKREERRNRWSVDPIGRGIVWCERAAGRAIRAIDDSIRSGVKAAPEGWRQGRSNARPGVPWVRDRIGRGRSDRVLAGFEPAPISPGCAFCGTPLVGASCPKCAPRDESPGGAHEPVACPGCGGSGGDCEQCGADGVVPAWSVDPKFGVVPEETPAPTGGGQATPNEGAHQMAGTEGVAVRETDLQTVAELDGEAQQADGAAQSIGATLQGLADWAGRLGDRYAAAPFATKAITDAVTQVIESAPDGRALLAFAEALDGLRSAIKSADTVAEAVAAEQAQGNTEAFQAA